MHLVNSSERFKRALPQERQAEAQDNEDWDETDELDEGDGDSAYANGEEGEMGVRGSHEDTDIVVENNASQPEEDADPDVEPEDLDLDAESVMELEENLSDALSAQVIPVKYFIRVQKLPDCLEIHPCVK